MPPKAKEKPALIPGLRRAAIRVSAFQRRIKLLRPICATCQAGQDVPEDWWKTCDHNPYISVVEKVDRHPKYEDLENGKKRITGYEEIASWEERPNWTQVTLHPRINNATGVERKMRRYGFIFPEELRSPLFPDGIANCCEFSNCFVQKDLKQYIWGTYCRRVEAQLVGHDIRMSGGGGALEVGVGQQAAEKQRGQLEEVPL
jgi:hypothetical protein